MNTKNGSLECLQDGLFFGLNYLKKNLTLPDFSSYFREGDLIFKGQKVLSLEEDSQKSAPNKESLSFLLSYLSGAYTLISCFTERNFDFEIGAATTKDFLYREGEEQAILKAGAIFCKKLKKPTPNFNEFLKELRKKPTPKESYFLNDEIFSLQEIKETLETFPEQSFEIKANLLPSHLEKWRHFKNIKTVHPSCLQGSFPLLKMQWSN